MSWRVTYNTGFVSHPDNYYFENERLAQLWNIEINQIKNLMHNINNNDNVDRSPWIEAWLNHVADFTNRWGHSHLPIDIRVVVNQIEGDLGRAVTVWEAESED